MSAWQEEHASAFESGGGADANGADFCFATAAETSRTAKQSPATSRWANMRPDSISAPGCVRFGHSHILSLHLQKPPDVHTRNS